MNVHKHRFLIAAFKLGTFVAWLAGVPDPIIAAIVTPWACWFAYTTIRNGLRENFVADLKTIYRWNWEDLVWNHTQWLNTVKGRLETPEEGIERLTRHLVPDPAPVVSESPTTTHSTATTWVNWPEPASTVRAPHELALR